MVIPAKVRKEAGLGQGDIVEVKTEGDGRIVLIRLERPKDSAPVKPKITYRKGTHAVGSTRRSITSAQVRNLLSEL